MMERRTVLGYLAAAGALCPACLSLAPRAASAAAGSHGTAPHWGYAGEAGPERWHALDPAFEVCGTGAEQSPVDLHGAVPARLGSIEIDYRPMTPRVVNNGHTIQVNCDPGGGIVLNGDRFRLVQFHFHHPSEHLLAGRAFDLEAHFVHAAESGALAVLGVLIQPGAANATLEPIWRLIPDQAGGEAVGTEPFSPADLLPTDRGHFRYAGSLTTPPCSQTVLWTVFRQPVTASPEQIRRFAELFPGNARPVQPINRRFLLESA
jgi:carbonic anhydrase